MDKIFSLFGNSARNTTGDELYNITQLLGELTPEETKQLSSELGIPPHSLERYLIAVLNGSSLTFETLAYEQQLNEYAAYRLGVSLMLYVAPLLIIIGSLGNLLSFIILRRRTMLKLSTYIYLLVLTVADTTVLLMGLAPLWYGTLTGRNPRDMADWSCKVIHLVCSTVTDYSVWLIVAVTVERYIVVCHPLHAPSLCTHRTARRLIVVLLGVLFLLNVHFAWTVKIVEWMHNDVVVERCAAHNGHEFFVERIWPWIDTVVYSFAPFVVIATLNVAIIRQVTVARRRRSQLEGGRSAAGAGAASEKPPLGKENTKLASNCVRSACSPQKNVSMVQKGNAFPMKNLAKDASATTVTRRSESRSDGTNLTAMLLTVSFAFLVTSLPMNIVVIAAAYNNSHRSNMERVASYTLARIVTQLFMFVNHAANFFLYCATGQKFRREFVETFRCCFRRRGGGGGVLGGGSCVTTTMGLVSSPQGRSSPRASAVVCLQDGGYVREHSAQDNYFSRRNEGDEDEAAML